jgi:hypothetical protein
MLKHAALLALMVSNLHSAPPRPIEAGSLTFRFTEAWDRVPYSLTEITGDYGYYSPPVALSLECAGYPCGGAYRRISLERGKLYALSAWVNGDWASTDMIISISVANEFFGVQHGTSRSQLASGWQHLGPWLFTKPDIYPDGTALYLGAEARSHDGKGSGRWIVGQIEIDEVDPGSDVAGAE